jgi:hypothetical protein
MPGTTKPFGIPYAPPGKHTPWEALSVFMKLSEPKAAGPPRSVGNAVPKAGDIDDAVDEQRGIRQHCVQQLEEAARIIEDEAKRVIGTYEYGWPPLQPATVARKAADTPLYETGEMRDSIEHYVDPQSLKAEVGSNNPKALWHELGTVTIPARSFLMGAAMRKEKEIVERTGVNIHGLITRQLGISK